MTKIDNGTAAKYDTPTRLRRMAADLRATSNIGYANECERVANEIERLRADLLEYQKNEAQRGMV